MSNSGDKFNPHHQKIALSFLVVILLVGALAVAGLWRAGFFTTKEKQQPTSSNQINAQVVNEFDDQLDQAFKELDDLEKPL